MNKLYAIVAACAAIGTITLVIHERRRDDAALADVRQQLATLSSAVASDRNNDHQNMAEDALIRFMRSAPAAALPAPAAPVAISPAVSHPPPESHPESHPVEMPVAHAQYESTFAGDPVDPEWTARDRRAAETKLTAALPEGSTLRSFECRASLCRVETRHSNVSRYNEFAWAAFMSPPTEIWSAGAVSVPLADEEIAPGQPIVMVSYVAREGKTLPAVATE